jgi:hypothetical protein
MRAWPGGLIPILLARLILLWSLGQGSAWVKSEGNEREEDADCAKSETDQNAKLKEAGLRRGLYFHK